MPTKPTRRPGVPYSRPQPRLFQTERECYVAYIDILGFSDRVLSDFEATVAIYEEMISRHLEAGVHGDFTIRVLSDSFVLTTTDFVELLHMSQLLHSLALGHDYLVRGGIGFGRHVESLRGGGYYVVSQALVRAVATERHVGRPCIALDESVVIPQDRLNPGLHPTQSGLLRFDNIWCVVPFHSMWARSARDRVCFMLENFPEHRQAFKWFLDFYHAVFPNQRED